jgi:hypothetical protein
MRLHEVQVVATHKCEKRCAAGTSAMPASKLEIWLAHSTGRQLGVEGLGHDAGFHRIGHRFAAGAVHETAAAQFINRF